MKMGDCEPSYGYGKAHVVSGHWFSPWHTGREPDLSNPFQGLFSRMPCGAKGSEGFSFNCGGLGAGGVFTRCFGPRSREDSMAGPLGNGAEGGPGGEEGGGVPKGV